MLWAVCVVLGVVSGLVLGRGELLLHRGSGWAAILFLLATLSVSPLARLGRRLGPRGTRVAVAATGARRWLGVTAFGVATVHAALAVLGHLGAAAFEIDRY